MERSYWNIFLLIIHLVLGKLRQSHVKNQSCLIKSGNPKWWKWQARNLGWSEEGRKWSATTSITVEDDDIVGQWWCMLLQLFWMKTMMVRLLSMLSSSMMKKMMPMMVWFDGIWVQGWCWSWWLLMAIVRWKYLYLIFFSVFPLFEQVPFLFKTKFKAKLKKKDEDGEGFFSALISNLT